MGGKNASLGEIFIVQARPETVQSRKRTDFLEIYRLEEKGPVLDRGVSVGEKERRAIEELTSGYPDKESYFVARLAEGIDSISLNPDFLMKITLMVLEMEKETGTAR